VLKQDADYAPFFLEINCGRAAEMGMSFALPYGVLLDAQNLLSLPTSHAGATDTDQVKQWARALLSKLVVVSMANQPHILCVHRSSSEHLSVLYKGAHIMPVDGRQLLVSVSSMVTVGDTGNIYELRLAMTEVNSNTHWIHVLGESDLPFPWCIKGHDGAIKMTAPASWPASWSQDLMARIQIDPKSKQLVLVPLQTILRRLQTKNKKTCRDQLRKGRRKTLRQKKGALRKTLQQRQQQNRV
jgi:hypothetical protein